MQIRTDPEVKDLNDIFSEELTQDAYYKSIKEMMDYGYEPTSIKIKRSVLPSFKLGVPVKLLADWDAEVKDVDMIIGVRRKLGD